MNIAPLAKWVLGLLDALTLLAIYATAEIRIEAGLLVLAIFLVRTLRIRLRSLGALVTPVLAFVCLGVFATLKFRVHPLVAAAHVSVVVHALLWLGRDSVRDRVLRLSMGFVNLTLAAVLTTDFYLFGAIFAFAILGSVYVSLGFLESTFREHWPEQLGQRLPPGYLKNMLSVSLAVFLISLLLFPLIPRASWRQWSGGSAYQVGFNDTVDLTVTGQSAASQSGRVALRIVSRTPEITDNPREAIPWGLLKGRTLDLFDGKRWLPRSSHRARQKRVKPIQFPFAGAQFEVIREPQVTQTLFVPYGATVGDVDLAAGRSHYLLRLASAGRSTDETGLTELQDAPDDKDLEVPAALRRPALTALSASILGKAQSSSEKARALGAFFRTGFTGTLEATQSARDVPDVLGNFLLKGRKGSCELFAASAAILLRLGGVPARVIAGFRVTRPPAYGLLTVLDNDAHAWVEYWSDAEGWLPFDPTPQLAVLPSWSDGLEQLYWFAQGKWYYWMVDFGKSADSGGGGWSEAPRATWNKWNRWSDWSARLRELDPAARAAALAGLELAAALVAALLAGRLLLGPLALRELRPLLARDAARRRLYLEFLRHERVVRRLGARPAPGEWQELYLRMRFGRPAPGAFEQRLGRLRALTAALRQGGVSAPTRPAV